MSPLVLHWLASVALAFVAPGEVRQTLTPLTALGGPPTGAATARIGQPIEWRIESAGTPLARAAEEDGVAGLSAGGWLVLDGPRALGPHTRVYTLCALDAGVRALPALAVGLADGEAAEAPAATLEVLGELAEGEDAPRPNKGFRSVPDRTVATPSSLGGALAVFAALGTGGLALAARKRRRRTAAATVPAQDARARLAALAQAFEAGALDPAATVGALGPLVRALVDERLVPHGEARAEALARARAATDAEWLAALPTSAPPAAAACVVESARVRFSGASPTPFAARGLLDEARAVAEQLAQGGQA